jgi:DNA replication and repair protein RecF
MIIRHLTVANVRSHELFTIELHPELTLILGQNGAGKTTLLEAIYALLRGTSFRGRDRDMIAQNKDSGSAKIEFTANIERRLTLTHQPGGRIQKEFKLDGKKSARLPAADRLPVVLFDPDQLRLLTSSPSRRREFIDGVISRLSPTYSTVLSRYNRVLLQRNELLKQYTDMGESSWEGQLFAWDVKLAELGATIAKARRNFLDHSNQHLTNIYRSIAGNDSQTIAAAYLSDTRDISQQTLLGMLQKKHHQDALRGYTSVGPHRDDILLTLNGAPASDSASRGELRTIMLAFKLLEVELQEHHSGQKPLILLDDVFSELDNQRETKLMQALTPYQTIITATDLRDELKINATTIIL